MVNTPTGGFTLRASVVVVAGLAGGKRRDDYRDGAAGRLEQSFFGAVLINPGHRLRFPGHGECLGVGEGAETTELGIITEVMDAAELEKIVSVADVVQPRNMQNFRCSKVGMQQNQYY